MTIKKAQESSFFSFQLTPEQEVEGYTFNELNMAVIQNLISASAEDIIRIRLDGKMLTQEEEVKLATEAGKIEILKYLLAASNILKEELEANKVNETPNFQNQIPTQEGN